MTGTVIVPVIVSSGRHAGNRLSGQPVTPIISSTSQVPSTDPAIHGNSLASASRATKEPCVAVDIDLCRCTVTRQFLTKSLHRPAPPTSGRIRAGRWTSGSHPDGAQTADVAPGRSTFVPNRPDPGIHVARRIWRTTPPAASLSTGTRSVSHQVSGSARLPRQRLVRSWRGTFASPVARRTVGRLRGHGSGRSCVLAPR